MKIFTLVGSLLLLAGTSTYAQWLDNSNKFNDSLHMPVSVTAGGQARPIIVKSEDGGYFVLWEDERNSSATKRDIYAQKYDKDGKRLWAADGVPVASSVKDELWQSESFGNYRRYPLAAQDGAGGLYVCWNYILQTGANSAAYGVAAQHLRADGSVVFGDGGFDIAIPAARQYGNPQIVPDSRGGFFIAYTNFETVYAFCYKDEGGTMKRYGGGVMNQHAKEVTTTTECGTKYSVSFDYIAKVQSYNLYPDQQGGCNVVMALLTGVDEMYVGYNRLARVKKDCHTTVLKRVGGADPATTAIIERDYKKDSIVQLYNLTTYSYDASCHPVNNPNVVIAYTNTRIENNGYGWLPLNFTSPRYYTDLTQGVILPTGGNINAEIISAFERDAYTSNYHLHGYYRLNEIYDSIPYELCSDLDHPYEAYRPILPDNAIPTDTLSGGPDTLIGHTIDRGSQNYMMAGSGNKVWMSILGSDGGTTSVYLQELKLVSDGTKRYKFVINTNDKLGLKIGEQIPIGNNVLYNTPGIATDSNGHALYYILESNRYARVSPIADGGILSWGSMGRPVGSGYWKGTRSSSNPMAVLSYDGKALIAWDSDRQNETSTGQNVWMQRISDVFTPTYQPPLNTLSLLSTSSYASIGTYFPGYSNVLTTIDAVVFNFSGGNSVTTPVVSITDNYPLGLVQVQTYDNTQPTRFTNGIPYLNRNFTINVGNNPNGSGNIPMRFYFPQAQFDALKTADPGISSPGDLGIIEQPSTAGATVPSTYTPNPGEQVLSITGWGAINGGYYIEFIGKGFSNFFITKGVVPLPLKWLDVTGKLSAPTAAAITWTVTEEKNVKGYMVQYSADGVNFVDGCTTGSTNSGVTTSYSCTVALPAAGTYSFRVKQEDIDGHYSYSKIIVLTSGTSSVFSVSPNPVSSTAVLRVPVGSVVKKLTLLNISGQAVWQSAGAVSGAAVTIPMEQLPAGVYHLQVMEDKEVKVLKIIKK